MSPAHDEACSHSTNHLANNWETNNISDVLPKLSFHKDNTSLMTSSDILCAPAPKNIYGPGSQSTKQLCIRKEKQNTHVASKLLFFESSNFDPNFRVRSSKISIKENSHEYTLKHVLNAIAVNAPFKNTALSKLETVNIILYGKRILPILPEGHKRLNPGTTGYTDAQYAYIWKSLTLAFSKSTGIARRACFEILARSFSEKLGSVKLHDIAYSRAVKNN